MLQVRTGSSLKAYYQLTKPGIIYGNDLPAIAGFFLASKGNFNFGLFIPMIVGLSLVIASACTFNNFIDKDVDSMMERTRKRALVTGKISGKDAIKFAVLLGVLGVLTLAIFTNLLTALIGLFGEFFYVVVYGYHKRKSSFGTIVGSVAGAVPPVVGYTAVTNRIDIGAILLFLILVFWQMPHFYSIAIYRLKDYKRAKIPVLPSVKGLMFTKVSIFAFTLGFTLAVIALSVLSYTGTLYIIVMALASLIWLIFSAYGFITDDSTKWARKMFFIH